MARNLLDLLEKIFPGRAYSSIDRGATMLLYFYIPECGSCRVFKRHFPKSVESYVQQGRLEVFDLEVKLGSDVETLFDALKLEGFPTCVLIRDGNVLDILPGSVTKRDFLDWIAEFLP